MSERIIKTGLGPRYKDMLDAVIGQMSDGYWENTPMMRGYWKFVTTGTSGNEVTLNVDEVSDTRDGDGRVYNRFYGMSDEAVKKFFADKIKFLIKEEGLGKWARDNESETDYLSYSDPYRVKDCYYAYEVLKGRDARKHPEYGDVEESRQPAKENHKTGIKLAKKSNEGLRDLKTFKKDVVYVPEFTDEKDLNAVVHDIHALYKNGEDGWEGDAQSFSSIQRVMELTDFPYLIAIGGSDMLFAFQSKFDRDVIVSDYLRDPDMI